MTVKHSTDVEAKNVAAGKDTTIQVLISSKEGPNFALRKFSMQQGGRMPRHTNMVEHEQYVLHGEAKITIGEETHHVKQEMWFLSPKARFIRIRTRGMSRLNSCALSPTRKIRLRF